MNNESKIYNGEIFVPLTVGSRQEPKIPFKPKIIGATTYNVAGGLRQETYIGV